MSTASAPGQQGGWPPDRERVAVYGGSFNPPHVAHAMVIAWLRWTRRADRVLVVPVFRHAFEGLHDKTLAPFDLRLDWCRAMVRDVVGPRPDPALPPVEVLDVEARLPTPSYTVATLRHLQAERPGAAFRPVVGADVLPQLPRWREWATLQAGFPPLVVGRQGYDGPDDSVVFPEVSSSTIRRRLVAGRSVDHLLPASVLALLDPETAHGLWD